MRRGLTIALACVAAFAAPVAAWAAPDLPDGFAARASADGLALTAANGQPLYRLDLDRAAKRRRGSPRPGGFCPQACRQLWRSVAPPQGFAAKGDWGSVARDGGSRQITYKGDPLYTFAGKDLAEAARLEVFPPYLSSYSAKPALMVEGVPFTSVYWHEADYQPPAPKTTAPAGVGVAWVKTTYVFVDAGEHPLYLAPGSTDCAQHCQGAEPLAAPLAANPVGRWRPVQTADGDRAWSYAGRLVYRGETDSAPGEGWTALPAR